MERIYDIVAINDSDIADISDFNKFMEDIMERIYSKTLFGCQMLVEYHGKDVVVMCPYNKQRACTHDNPAILTSTLFGATPSDCPLRKEGYTE